MIAHTPGPWTVVDQRGSDDDDIAPHIFVESHGVGHVGQIETIEDARLIAAAPALLDALEDCTARLRMCAIAGGNDKEMADILVAKYLAVIKQARGES